MEEKGQISLKTIPIAPLHDMRLVDGLLADLMCLPYSEDYVWVTVRDELVPPDARLSLTTVFPNLMKFTVSNSRTKYDVDVLARESMENKSVQELFSDFYRLQNNDQPPSDLHMKVLNKALKEWEEEAHEAR